MKPTIADIAKMSGFSKTTVSRVLSNSENVCFSTRERILQIISENRYRPSEVARSLAKGSTNLIALIVGDITNPYYIEIAKVIQQLMYSEGYMVILCNSDFDHRVEDEYLDTIMNNNIAGVFMISSTGTSEKLSEVLESGIPVVMINRYLPGVSTNTVLIDEYLGVQMATNHLIGLGHKKIALLNAPPLSSSAINALNGFRSALDAAGLRKLDEYIVEVELRHDKGYEFGLKLLHSDITAVVCLNIATATGVIDAFRNNGKNIPDDLSVVGYDISSQLNDLAIKLTTVGVPQIHIGKRAANIMLPLLRKSKDVSDVYERVVLEPKLIVGKSTAKLQ